MLTDCVVFLFCIVDLKDNKSPPNEMNIVVKFRAKGLMHIHIQTFVNN